MRDLLAPIWLNENEEESLYNKDFCKIVRFYVLHSPCKDRSYTSFDLEEYGWKNPWRSTRFKDLIKEVAGFSKRNYFFAEKQEDFLVKWEDSQLQNDFYNINGQEFVVFAHAGESNQYLDLLHRIRNSLAHGRFKLKRFENDVYLYMEDVAKSGNDLKVTARMIFKIKTLKEIIKVFTVENKDAEALQKDLLKNKEKENAN